MGGFVIGIVAGLAFGYYLGLMHQIDSEIDWARDACEAEVELQAATRRRLLADAVANAMRGGQN